ncbi:unnamed protein product [Closterium sp. NIES-54]
MTLRPSTAPQRVPLPSPPASSLLDGPGPQSDSLRATSPTVTRFQATAVTHPFLESSVVSALVAELVDFAAACRQDYVTCLVAESASTSVCPPSVGGKCALGTDVLEDRQEDLECFAAAVPHLVSMLLAPEGDHALTPLCRCSTLSSPPLDESVEPSGPCTGMLRRGCCATCAELRWLTYLLTDLGERPCSSPFLYVDNKAMIALCQEHRLEHRTKYIALRYFLARELQQRGQLRLAYVACQANTTDVFTKALQPCDHQRFCTILGLALYEAIIARYSSLATAALGHLLLQYMFPELSAFAIVEDLVSHLEGAAGTGGGGGAGAGDPTEARGAGAVGAGAGGTGVGCAGAGGAGAVDRGAGGAGGTVRPRTYFFPLLQQVLGVLPSTDLTPPLLCPPPDHSQPPLPPASLKPAPSP